MNFLSPPFILSEFCAHFIPLYDNIFIKIVATSSQIKVTYSNEDVSYMKNNERIHLHVKSYFHIPISEEKIKENSLSC